MIKLEMKSYYINKKAAEIPALSSGKNYKYEYLTGKEILPSNQQQIIEQAKFNYYPLGKACEKQIKTIEDQREKQVEALKQTKGIKGKSDNKISIQKENYDRLLSGTVDEIQKRSG